MDLSKLEELKKACPGDNPVGENCEYDELFLEMDRAAQPRPEIQYGKTIVPARPPDWMRVLDCAAGLAERTRDLRVAVPLLESLSQHCGWTGFAVGLEILDSWTESFWDSIHPQADDEAPDDSTARQSALAYLVSDEFLMRSVYHLPLAQHKTLGCVTLRDYLSKEHGKIVLSSVLTSSNVEAIFEHSGEPSLRETLSAIERSHAALTHLDRFLTTRLGSQRWSAARLLEPIAHSHDVVAYYVEKVASAACSAPSPAPPPAPIFNADGLSIETTLVSESFEDDQPAEPETLTLPITTKTLAPEPLRGFSRDHATCALNAVCPYCD